MTEEHTRAAVRLLAFAAAFALIGVSIAMNLQAGLAKSETFFGQATWAVASVASDVLKAVAPIFIAWAIVRRDTLRVLAGIAILVVTGGYAGISAISYSHGSRVDLAGVRGAEAATRERADISYRQAETSLSAILSARPVPELKAGIAALLVDPNAGDCTIVDGPVTRRICPQVAELRTELGRAEERARLQGEMKQAKAELDGLPPPKSPDPAADAVTRFLGEIGLTAHSQDVALWLSLSGVLLVEVGSVFGLLLATGGAGPSQTFVPNVSPSEQAGPSPSAVDNALAAIKPGSPPQVAPTSATPAKSKRGRPRRGTAAALDKLKELARNGEIEASQSTFGELLGISKATAHRELRRLEQAGSITLVPSRRGTLVTVH